MVKFLLLNFLYRYLKQPIGSPVVIGNLKDQITGKSLHTETTNYLGWSNKHQPPMYSLLMKEAVQVRYTHLALCNYHIELVAYRFAYDLMPVLMCVHIPYLVSQVI